MILKSANRSNTEDAAEIRIGLPHPRSARMRALEEPRGPRAMTPRQGQLWLEVMQCSCREEHLHDQWMKAEKCGSNYLIPNAQYILPNPSCPPNHELKNGVCCPTKVNYPIKILSAHSVTILAPLWMVLKIDHDSRGIMR
ncbi:hypothetical protein OSTOST_05146 [Ostertagia ostertagi]